ncbi:MULTISPECIES: hypothetical protein [unclassified Mesorhizobium]|uniref:hypothetical protein n=1 Tax=unclassified Mesorhizobium TaxID=325217 RepID=UPI000FEC0103|nr:MULTISPECIES: hypothetical protein [unclassified Mesorhizobium]TGR99807.1 hypothetical protein EN831_23150 [Mesorhizobium sp. M1C.F.Ca.ET.188.01.1.1]
MSKIPDGYPPDVAVSAGADGLPVFFDVQGDRLFRIWGPSRLSAVELRALKLESTELIFPGGRLYRKVPA